VKCGKEVYKHFLIITLFEKIVPCSK